MIFFFSSNWFHCAYRVSFSLDIQSFFSQLFFALSYIASIYEVTTCLNLLCASQSNLQCDAKGKQYVFLLLQSASLFSPPRRVWCSVLLPDNTVKQSFVKRSRRPYLSLERKSSLLYLVLLQYQNKNNDKKHPPLCFSLWGCFSSTLSCTFFLLVFYFSTKT